MSHYFFQALNIFLQLSILTNTSFSATTWLCTYRISNAIFTETIDIVLQSLPLHYHVRQKTRSQNVRDNTALNLIQTARRKQAKSRNSVNAGVGNRAREKCHTQAPDTLGFFFKSENKVRGLWSTELHMVFP